jgi:Co/Zn/Cd efflux system component
MKKTLFNIPKMDCPSEENLIRIKLEGVEVIKKLDFDIDKRELLVYHIDNSEEIESKLYELNFGAKKISSLEAQKEEIENNNGSQRKLLWTVLIINFSFFILELLTGLISKSMGLVADSLDMLADSFVYGLSLMVIGSTLIKKKRVSKIAGYSQIVLAVIGFIEVVRRFIGNEYLPDFSIMITVSILSIIDNGVCLYLFQKSNDKKEAHMKASMIFTSNDIVINFGVIVAGLLVYSLESNIPDLVIGLIVFVIVVNGAIRILKI